MRLSNRAFRSRLLRGSFCLATAIVAHPALAQTASEQPQPSSQLPPIEVEATATKTPAKEKAAPSKPKQQTSVQAAPAPEPAARAQDRPETAVSPVQGFVAKVSGTATKSDTPLIETPQAVSVVTRDQMDQQSATSVKEALQYTSGVAAGTRSAFGGYDIVYSRGFVLDRYLDGLKYLGGANYTTPQIELYGLERLEVLHGPASMLYGSASPGGIVNAISKRPTDEPFHEIQLSFGNFDRVQAAFDFSGPVDSDKRWSYRLSGLASGVDSQVDFNEQERYWIAPALTWRPVTGTTLTFLANLQHDPDVGLYNNIPSYGSVTPSPFGEIPRHRFLGEPSYNVNNRDQQSVGYAFESHLNDSWTVRQNLRYMHTDGAVHQFLPFPDGMLDPTTMLRFVVDQTADIDAFSVDTNAEAKFRTGPLAHTLLFGVDYQHLNERSFVNLSLGAPIDIFNPVYGDTSILVPGAPEITDQVLDQTGIYVQDQVKWDRAVFTLGLRQDYASTSTDDLLGVALDNSQDDEEFTQRYGITYLLDGGFAPYVSYSTSFQPTLGSSGGRAFEPTTGEQYEVGIKYEPTGYKALFTLAAYDLTQQNVVTADPALPATRVQIGEVRSRGFEAEGKVSLTDQFDLIGSYTLVDAEITESLNPTILGKHPLNIPDQLAALWAFYRIDDGPLAGLGFGGGVRYVGESAGNEDNTLEVPDFTLFDAAAQYDFGALSPRMAGTKLLLNVSNIFDEKYVSQCTNRETCLYGNGRTVITSIKYQW